MYFIVDWKYYKYYLQFHFCRLALQNKHNLIKTIEM